MFKTNNWHYRGRVSATKYYPVHDLTTDFNNYYEAMGEDDIGGLIQIRLIREDSLRMHIKSDVEEAELLIEELQYSVNTAKESMANVMEIAVTKLGEGKPLSDIEGSLRFYGKYSKSALSHSNRLLKITDGDKLKLELSNLQYKFLYSCDFWHQSDSFKSLQDAEDAIKFVKDYSLPIEDYKITANAESIDEKYSFALFWKFVKV